MFAKVELIEQQRRTLFTHQITLLLDSYVNSQTYEI